MHLTSLAPAMHGAILDQQRSAAIAVHADYPQYDGKFDAWVLGRMVRPWQGKGSSSFVSGQLVLMSPAKRGEEWRSVFCPTTGSVCAVSYDDVCAMPV